MRGRLVFPFLVELAQLDTVATNADPDAGGPLTSGYDHVFREPVQVPQAGSQTGTSARQESTLRVPAQIEPQAFDSLQMFAGGANLDRKVSLVIHYRHLEQNSLVDANGEPQIRIGDRLNAIHKCDAAETLITTIRTPPGLYAVEVQDRGFGFGRERNLLRVTFDERETSDVRR